METSTTRQSDMIRLLLILLLASASIASAQSWVIVDQTNSLSVDLSEGKYSLPPEVKINPYDYIAFCDPEPCSEGSIQFKSIEELLECGPNEYELSREDREYITADGGVFCARVPVCKSTD